MADDNFEMHAIVKGLVQGVGFRATARHYANQLGLKGTVRNLANGSVEIYAEGPKESLEKLLHKLQYEAEISIHSIQKTFSPPTGKHPDFRIVH